VFSYHPNQKDIGKYFLYALGWKTAEVDDPKRIAVAVSRFMTSPIVWDGGRRHGCYFLAANWIGLDFDNGHLSLDGAVEAFKEYTHVIGTSHHHQKPKGSEPPRDRFHVFLRLPLTITEKEKYLSLVRFYIEAHKGADTQAKDAARMFKPCPKIVSVVESETPLPVKTVKKTYAKQNATRLPPGNIPRWVLQLLQYGVGYGISRNTTCYKIARVLKEQGFTESAVVDLLMSSRVPLGPEVRSEVEQAVRSGFK
jgi:hypothetical protein